jgi:uncharacterized protein
MGVEFLQVGLRRQGCISACCGANEKSPHLPQSSKSLPLANHAISLVHAKATTEGTAMRLLIFALAWLMVAIGIVGIFLPVLPTTPFMILAAALFARSSPRFEQWLLDHPRYGQPLIDWRREGAISRRAKITSVSLMAVSFVIVVFLGPPQIWLKLLVGVILAVCAAFILSRPAPGR